MAIRGLLGSVPKREKEPSRRGLKGVLIQTNEESIFQKQRGGRVMEGKGIRSHTTARKGGRYCRAAMEVIARTVIESLRKPRRNAQRGKTTLEEK